MLLTKLDYQHTHVKSNELSFVLWSESVLNSYINEPLNPLLIANCSKWFDLHWVSSTQYMHTKLSKRRGGVESFTSKQVGCRVSISQTHRLPVFTHVSCAIKLLQADPTKSRISGLYYWLDDNDHNFGHERPNFKSQYDRNLSPADPEKRH